MKKYFSRFLRYFVYLSIVWVVVIGALVSVGYASFSLDNIGGLLETSNFNVLVIVVFVFALLYPKVGYVNKTIPKIGSEEELLREFYKLGIVKCRTEGSVSYYRYESIGRRFMVRFDDTFSIEHGGDYAVIDGNRVMVARVMSRIEYVSQQ